MKKYRNEVHNQKHLTLSDRIYIEQEICQSSSFKSIAASLHKDPSTISKEIRRNRKKIEGHLRSAPCHKCKLVDHCSIKRGDSEVSDCFDKPSDFFASFSTTCIASFASMSSLY